MRQTLICLLVNSLAAIATINLAESQIATGPSGRVDALMPTPASVAFDAGTLRIDSTFQVSLSGYRDQRLERAALRCVRRVSRQTGVPLREAESAEVGGATLQISCEAGASPVQSPIEDESYALVVTPAWARLIAPKPYGVLRGLETFLQLMEADSLGFSVPCVRIKDAPRFPWRGLLIDVCRHWMPIEMVKRNLDAMAAVKLNVLHWHLSEDQAFRIESKRFPELHQKGSEGSYFTQEQVREVLACAADRGIRVVPEFDMPGHSTSWFVSHPELASAPGPYELARTWGIFDPAMDPTKEDVYTFIDQFVDEMSSLFPDPYFHIGGDEVTGRQWNGNPRIEEFKRAHNMDTNHDLQVYFNRRLLDILQKHGKKMVGWDEILHPDLPKDIVVQSWRGQKRLVEAAKGGYQSIMSSGYYLDLLQPASYHYGIDPFDKEAADLSASEKALILGGEACMWAESVTSQNVDSRLWPRCAVVAERLWSPAQVKDTADMYRRLDVVSKKLEWLGVAHRISYTLMLQRLTNYEPVGPLKTLTDALEPVKGYERIASHKYLVTTPLNRVVDAVPPESNLARQFASMVDQFLADPAHSRNIDTMQAMLTTWSENHVHLMPLIRASFLLREIEPVSRDFSEVARAGLNALRILRGAASLSGEEQKRQIDLLEGAAKAQAELLIMVVPPIRRLAEAAYASGAH